MRVVSLIVALAFPFAGNANERPPEVARIITEAELRGAATVDFLSVPLYEARLWTPDQRSVDQADKFALTLTYKRGFKAGSLARASVKEIARMEDRPVADFEDLERILQGCFADVGPDDRITGLSESEETASFFVNGVQSCRVSYPKMRDRFFGIWLGDNSRDARITAQIRGDV
jgi:hypothetical protein